MFRSKITAFLLVFFSILSLATSVSAISEENMTKLMQMSEQERKFLLMYFDEDELFVVSTTRSLKSISRIAENVEVVTAADIELMNAHTLADVLNTVNGLVVGFAGASPGSIATVNIQGSNDRHVTVFLDGIPYNNLADNLADIRGIQVQFIDRIEIIKGPASSSWGSSLGGIVNIITKSSGKAPVGGMVSASLGERNTGDYQVEVSGSTDKLGYALFAGRLSTDGLRAEEDFSQNSLYSKLSYRITPGTNIIFSLLYSKNDGDLGDLSDYDQSQNDEGENLLASLIFDSALTEDLALNVSLRAASQVVHRFTKIISTGEVFPTDYDDKKYGGSVKLIWKLPNNDIVLGYDYDDGSAKSNTFFDDELKSWRWAFYANDTIQLGNFSLTPGLRYDNTNIGGDFVSPSFGITYQLQKNTVLRAFIARGFSVPPLSATDGDSAFFRHNPHLKMEKVWSYQAGLETTTLKYMWVKLSAFRHDITDAIVGVPLPDYMFTYENKDRVRRQGFEAEIRTPTLYHASLFAGATFIDTKNLDTDEEIKGVPTYTYDVGLKYDDEKSLRALLKGRTVWWNQRGDLNAKYNGVIFDFNIIKTFSRENKQAIEVFFTAHNIFNGSQYWIDVYKNAGRWIEGGLRIRF